MLANFEGWIDYDDDTRLRRGLSSQIANQYYRYLNNVMWQIGGIYLYDVKEDVGVPAVAVDKARQKESVKWLLEQARECAWINCPEVTGKFPLHTNYSNTIAGLLASSLVGKIPGNVLMSSHITDDSEAYTLNDYYTDLYNEVFKSSLQNKKLNSEEKSMQRIIVADITRPMILSRNVTKLNSDNQPLGYMDNSDLPSLDELVFTGDLDNDFMAQFGDELRRIESEYGKGSVAASLSGLSCNFGEDREPFQSKLSTVAIDETTSYSQQLTRKINKLAKSRVNSAPAADRAHYEYLLNATSMALGE